MKSWRENLSASYSSYSIFSRVELDGPSISSSAGQYLFEFVVRLTPLNPHLGALILSNFNAEIFFGSNRLNVAGAHPRAKVGAQHSISIKHQANSQHERQIVFSSYIGRPVLEAIEEIRNGQDAQFFLSISGTVVGMDADNRGNNIVSQNVAWPGMVLFNTAPSEIFNPETFCLDTQRSIPQSQWSEMLNAVGYQPALLFEIPILLESDHPSVHPHVKGAQKAFTEGRYVDVVARCREALDSFATKSETGASYLWTEAGKKETREKLSVEDNFRLNWAALHLLTNSGHHRDKLKTEFTRAMAHYVLGATCLMLSLAGKERDLVMRPPTKAAEDKAA